MEWFFDKEGQEVITQSIKKLFFVSRPISWINTAYPFAAAYLVSGGIINPFFIIATLYFLIPYNLLMYGVNDVFDYESDIQNPRKGGIEGMREQKAFHPTILLTSIILTVPFLVTMVVFGTVAADIGLFVLTFFVIAYSMKWLRFKERPILDSVTSSIHFTGPAVYALLLIGFHPAAWPFIAALFLWGMASHALGAVQDIIPDCKARIGSIATVFGARFTMVIVLGLYLIASFIVILQGIPTLFIFVTGLIYIINIVPYMGVNDEQSPTVNRAWRRFIWLNMIAGFVVTMVLLSRLSLSF
jgi:4-hydroxybenzoate polyprenyltransferase